MIRQVRYIVLGTLLVTQLVDASKYGSNGAAAALYLGGGGGDDGGQSDGSNQLDLSSMLSLPQFVQSGPTLQSAGGASVPAAIQTKRTVEVKPVNIPKQPVEPHIVDVEATYQPVHVVFRSSSSPVMVQQIHTPAQPSTVEPTQSEDEPHRVQHQVLRPVIQEVREIIQPYRRVLQEIRPVLEEVKTVVARAESNGARSNGGLANAGGASTAQQSAGVQSSAQQSAAGYGSSAGYAAASVPAPTYSRGRRSSTSAATGNARATQRQIFQRRPIVAKRQQQQVYSSL